MSKKFTPDDDLEMQRLYEEEMLNVPEIGKKFNVSGQSIRYRLKGVLGVIMRPREKSRKNTLDKLDGVYSLECSIDSCTNERIKFNSQWSSYCQKHLNEKARISSDKKRVRRVQLIVDYLLDHPCDCGEDDPLVLQFHHVDPKTKDRTVLGSNGSTKWQQMPIKKFWAEIAKCEVLCANCHARTTAYTAKRNIKVEILEEFLDAEDPRINLNIDWENL